jgi:mono/diheme cytochrome c family protein
LAKQESGGVKELMRGATILMMIAGLLAACAAEVPYDPLQDYEELDSSNVVDSPRPEGGRFAPADKDTVDRGKYLVDLLGCGSCHTNGAFEGAPDMDMALAGSQTGIAHTNPLEGKHPGVVYPPNITPDEETGIGLWSDRQIAAAVSAGMRRHGGGRLSTMPWQSYARLNGDDIDAIVAYLRSIPPIRNEVPAEVPPGKKATNPFVYFGVYRSLD